MKAQIMAHKAALEKQQEELERANQEELDALKHQCELDMGECMRYRVADTIPIRIGKGVVLHNVIGQGRVICDDIYFKVIPV